MNTESLGEIESKARELCETIVSQPEFAHLFSRINTFLQDEDAKEQFAVMNEMADDLQSRHAAGYELTGPEIQEFEEIRNTFLGKESNKAFLDAQDTVQKIQSLIYRQLSKTFELGRVPVAEDFASSCCSPGGCGCN